MKLTSKKIGFTLLETLLYISLSTIIIGTLVTFVSSIETFRIRNIVVNEVEQSANQVIMLFTLAVRNSTAINSPTIGNSSNTSLSVNQSNGAISPTIFTYASNKITVKEGAGSDIDLLPSTINMTAFTVSNVGRSTTGGSLRLNFTLEYINTSGISAMTYSKSFYASATNR